MIPWSNTSTLIQLKTFLGKIPRRGQFNLVVSGSYDNIWLGERNFLETYSVVRGGEASEGEQNLIKRALKLMVFPWRLKDIHLSLAHRVEAGEYESKAESDEENIVVPE